MMYINFLLLFVLNIFGHYRTSGCFCVCGGVRACVRACVCTFYLQRFMLEEKGIFANNFVVALLGGLVFDVKCLMSYSLLQW
jgi:hypothetical protein